MLLLLGGTLKREAHKHQISVTLHFPSERSLRDVPGVLPAAVSVPVLKGSSCMEVA